MKPNAEKNAEQNAQRCAHPACKCSVTEGRRFCSEYCEQHSGKEDAQSKVMCGCGHPECGGTVSAA